MTRPAVVPRPLTRRGRAPVAGTLAALVVVGLLAVWAGPAPAATGRSGQPGPAGTLPTSTTVAPDGSSGSPTRATPTGAVAFVTPTGEVLVGQGIATPTAVGFGAAVGPAGVGAVALSPSGERVAWISAQGAVVARALDGSPAVTLASDAVTTVVGRAPVLAWNSDGTQVAYVAVGTKEMVEPRRTERGISTEGAFPVPLPSSDTLGNVVKTVSVTGALVGRLGDPSLRSAIGLTWSATTQLLVIQSAVPGTSRRYTLSVATPGAFAETPTLFSADDPQFSPDGRFLVAVGPSKGRQELLKVSTDTLDRTVLAVSSRICSPSVSPDSTRVVFGSGPRCRKVGLVSTLGGPVVDATPPRLPKDAVFGPGEFGWTAEGRYFTHALCRRGGSCGGPSVFYDYDTGRKLLGADASTVVTPQRAAGSAQQVGVDVEVTGPLRFSGSFPLDATSLPRLTDTTANDGQLSARLTNGDQTASIKVQGREGSPFVTGQLTVADPATGVDRTLFVLGRANLTGIQAFTISGIWISTDDLPFASGKFTWAVRRR
ncbi:MAG: hypothetical protein ACKO04_05295 [Actinomycetes bacterium]